MASDTTPNPAKARRVFLYTLPHRKSGAYLRLFSNCTAYLDLGFKPEIVQVNAASIRTQAGEFPSVVSNVEASLHRPTALGAAMYRIGYPGNAGAQYYFPLHDTIRREAQTREAQFPGSLHQFEYACESPIPFLPGLKTIWSCHDIPHALVEASQRIDQELASRKMSISERRQLRFVQKFGRRVAADSKLILTITPEDRDIMRSEWGCTNVVHLPMSIPAVPSSIEHGPWMKGGVLRLLHIGALGHLPTFRSLEFLLREVFPRLRKEVLERLSLKVIGEIVPGYSRCESILQLCSQYPQVEVLGRVDDLKSWYASSDLQVVASTGASGLRTRVIESFAFGLPVLSSSTASRGVLGLDSGQNIIIADTPEVWAEAFDRLLTQPGRLAALAENARQTYDEKHSASVVAVSLASALARTLGIPAPAG